MLADENEVCEPSRQAFAHARAGRPEQGPGRQGAGEHHLALSQVTAVHEWHAAGAPTVWLRGPVMSDRLVLCPGNQRGGEYVCVPAMNGFEHGNGHHLSEGGRQ
ncbi:MULTISPECIES: hypothetical protein [Streptomyces]|uniref:hypothetical protein n=1 Tax=Streptomyces TaxID=1883 RepID=UPI00131A0A6E|nr:MULTISPECIES: hypothetical protein [Streptomyces]MZD18247.1 hypothetical protein [Streptomyces sp. SID5476]